MLNRVILMGRLCADPELRQTQSGIANCKFRIAVNRPKKQDGTQEADFISCTAWRSTAEFVCRYFSKGSMIVIEGQLRNNDYTDGNGVKHYSMEVLADNVTFGESKNAGAAQQQNQQGGYQPNPYQAPPQGYQNQPPQPPPNQGYQAPAPNQGYQQGPPPNQYGYDRPVY